MHRTTPRCELPPAKAAWSTYREKTTAVGLTNGAGVFATLASSFRTCQNQSQIRADVAQPVEQRFRKPPVGSSSLPVGSGNTGRFSRNAPRSTAVPPQPASPARGDQVVIRIS